MNKASANPTVYFVRGYRYVFEMSCATHPFWFKTANLVGNGDTQHNAVPYGPHEALDYNGFDVGTVTFSVPLNYSYNKLYYNCEYHANMAGVIYIVDTPAQASASTLMASVFLVSSLIALSLYL